MKNQALIHDPEAMRQARDLGRLWLEGLVCAHLSGVCSCASNGLPMLNAGMLELDLLDYLSTRYSTSGQNELLALLADRRAQRNFQRSERFERWIMRMAAADIPAERRALLLYDLRTFLESLVGSEKPSGAGIVL